MYSNINLSNSILKASKNLLIFDLDGTLVDSVPDIAMAVNRTFSSLGYPPFQESQIRNWVGNGSLKLIERGLMKSLIQDDKSDSTKTAFSEELLKTHSLFLDEYKKCCAVHTEPFDYVNEGLNILKNSGYRLALVTNKPIAYVPEILETFAWSDLFDIILGGDSLSVKKPNAEPLLYVCNKLKFHVKQSIMIGDSKNDILAGQNCGMDTIGLSYGYNYGQDIREFNPSITFDTFKEMVDVLK